MNGPMYSICSVAWSVGRWRVDAEVELDARGCWMERRTRERQRSGVYVYDGVRSSILSTSPPSSSFRFSPSPSSSLPSDDEDGRWAVCCGRARRWEAKERSRR